MTAPNRNVLWARALVDELAKGGVDAACIAPGSRSTPLTVAFDAHDEIRVFSHLDERSAAFFALGRAKRTGRPTPLVCTSGTAAANFHPAVIEADRARVPLLLLTADRPPELRDSGANQTIDQEKLYGGSARWYADLPEPAADDRKLRSLRTTAARALASAVGVPPGPVHLNAPFRKPLEPVRVEGDVPETFDEEFPLAARGREGPYVRTTRGAPALADADAESFADAVSNADRGLIVAGPTDGPLAPIATLARQAGFPVLADPLSGLRFGPHLADVPVIGGYDSFLDETVTADWPDPDLVIRVGASPTSKALRTYLARADCRQLQVDPAGGWREATFTATDLVTADPVRFAEGVRPFVDDSADEAWAARWRDAEATCWETVEGESTFFEGAVLGDVAALAPDPSTIFVSNSMPVRDLDRFGRPREADLTALGNRGASGIDGITSAALGAGSATDDPLILVTGDLAYYHDMNGLLALSRCGVPESAGDSGVSRNPSGSDGMDATIVLLNNDGGGIFHMLPIEGFDPPFTGQFKTPHGLDFEPTGDLYDLEFASVDGRDEFREAFRESVESDGAQVIEVRSDAAASHRVREALRGDVLRNVRN